MRVTIQAKAWRASKCLAAMLILAAGCQQRQDEQSAVSFERLIGDDEDSPISDHELFKFENSGPLNSRPRASKNSEAKRRRAQDRAWKAERERQEREIARLRAIENPPLWKAANQETRRQLRTPVNVRFDRTELGDVLVELSCQAGATIVLDPRLETETNEWSQLLVTGSTDGDTPLWLALTKLLKPLGLTALAEFNRIAVTTLDFADEWLVANERLTPQWHEIPYTGINDPNGKLHGFERAFQGVFGPARQTALIEEICRSIEPESWAAAGGRGWIEHCAPLEYDGGSLVGDWHNAFKYFDKNLDSGILVCNSPAIHSVIRDLIKQRTIEEQAVYIEQERELYPYETMRYRLEYESSRNELVVSDKTPLLSAAATKELVSHENRYGKKHDKDGIVGNSVDMRRSNSFAMLHSEEVSKFIDRAGFGVTRSPPEGPIYVRMPEIEDVPFADVTRHADRSPADQFESGLLANTLRSRRLPNADILSSFHRGGYDNFVDHWWRGHVIDRDHVAGFSPHAFRDLPELLEQHARKNIPSPIDHWLVGRLELVSLLKFAEPAVYVSKHLPRMDKLVDAKTRPLNAFESEALSQLQAGDDLAVRYSLNHIQMVGSLRAMKQCLDCHQVERGELLGAFSYDLWRDPPQK